MINLIEYLKESDTKYGNPDHIKHNDKIYNYDSKFATAFIYNIKTGVCLWSKPGETHNDILFNLSDDERNKLNLYIDGKPIRYVEYLSSGELEKNNKCGRIWVVPNNISKNRKYDVYIAWWNILDNYDFINFNKKILKSYNKTYNMNLKSFIAIDNNGKFILITPEDKKINIDKTDKNRVEDLSILKWIHLTTQKEKKDYLYKTIKETDNKFQKKYYNKTSSKTAAEFYNNYSKKYDPISGKVYWGKHIGDSLINNEKII